MGEGMDLELAGRLAIVAGGSRGLGKASARAMAREGADIAIIARDLDVARAAAEQIASESGRRVEAFKADTGEDEAVRAAIAGIEARFGRIDILVNAAAQVAGHSRPPALAEITDEAFWSDMNIKVMGYLRCAREVAPVMARAGWGRIINISGLAARSTGSIIGTIRNISVAALTKNLADELGPKGINVTCLHPGLTRTEKTPDMLQRQARNAGVSAEEMENRIAQRNLIRRMVTAEEIGEIVAFLASPKSAPINGDSIAAGGGTPGVIHY